MYDSRKIKSTDDIEKKDDTKQKEIPTEYILI